MDRMTSLTLGTPNAFLSASKYLYLQTYRESHTRLSCVISNGIFTVINSEDSINRPP